MATRISRKRLESLVKIVSELQGRPLRVWNQIDGKNVSSRGAIHLDHAPCYGGWDLVEICNDGGGESSLIGNTFGGRGRVSAHEIETFLLGMYTALTGTAYWSPQSPITFGPERKRD